MSIRSIDYQVMLPKTSEVSKISNEMQQKEQVIQQQGNVFIQKQIDRNIRQVNSKQELYKVISDDRKNGGNHKDSENKKNMDNKIRPKNKESKDTSNRDLKALKNRIDIRI
jgi:hypothetical protein